MKYRHWILFGLEVLLLLLNLQAAPFLFVDFAAMDLLLGKHVLDQNDKEGSAYAFWMLVCFSVFTAGRFRMAAEYMTLLRLMFGNAIMAALAYMLFNLVQLVSLMDEKGWFHRYVIPALIGLITLAGLFSWNGWITIDLFSFRLYFRATHLIQVLLVLMEIWKVSDSKDSRSVYAAFAGSFAAGLLLLDLTQVIITAGLFAMYCRKNHEPVLWKGLLAGGAGSALMAGMNWSRISRMAEAKLLRIYGPENIVSDLLGNSKLIGSSGSFAMEFDGLIGAVNRYGLWVMAVVIALCVMLCVSCLRKRNEVSAYVGLIVSANCMFSVIGLVFPVQLSTCYIPFEYSVQLFVLLLLLLPFMDEAEEEVRSSFNIVA